MKKIKRSERNIKGIKASGVTESDNDIKSFIILIVVIAILIGVIYGLTELLKKNKITRQKFWYFLDNINFILNLKTIRSGAWLLIQQ